MKKFTELLGIEVPLICGAMYPCGNPELVAAASEAGAIGIVQPLTLTYVNGYEFRKGLKYIRSMTQKPIGMNLLIEQSSQIYIDRMKKFLDQSLEEGIRFYITALGNPDWVVKKVHAAGGIVFHDVINRKFALKAKEAGVDGLICVNSLAGGHAGNIDPETLYNDLKDLGLPLVCAGGIGDEKTYAKMLSMGYVAAQLGTRFLASKECSIQDEYKKAIIKAHASDIVLTEKISGVPIAVINNEYVQRVGNHASFVEKFLLKNSRTKHWMRLIYSVLSFRNLKKSMKSSYTDYYWQAGKSVEGIEKVESVAEIVAKFKSALSNEN
jgi:nitronate monooxygenase